METFFSKTVRKNNATVVCLFSRTQVNAIGVSTVYNLSQPPDPKFILLSFCNAIIHVNKWAEKLTLGKRKTEII